MSTTNTLSNLNHPQHISQNPPIILHFISNPSLNNSPQQLLQSINTTLLLLSKNNTQKDHQLNIQTYYFLAYYCFKLFKCDVYSQKQKKQINDFLDQWFEQISNKTMGTSLNFFMNQKYLQFFGELNKSIMNEKVTIDVLNFMKFWTRQLHFITKDIKSNKNLNIFKRIIEYLKKKTQFTQVQDKILFINYVYKDILPLLPLYILNPDSAIPTTSLDQVDSILLLLDIIFPKTTFRIQLSTLSFPPNVFEFEPGPYITLLYKVQCFQKIMKGCQYYCIFVKTLIKALIQHLDQLQNIQQDKLLEFVFRYYTVYHKQKKKQAQSFVLDVLNGIKSVVKFASGQIVSQFLNIITKLNEENKNDNFINKIFEKVNWVQALVKKYLQKAISKNHLQPLPSTDMQISIGRGAKQYRYIEIFRQLSLIYFNILVQSNNDINIRFVFAGGFDDPYKVNKQIFKKQRLKHGQYFRGSIEILNPGLYFFEFDNSYSWITSKTIKFQTIVLASNQVQIRNHQYNWIYADFIKQNNVPKIIKFKKNNININNNIKTSPQSITISLQQQEQKQVQKYNEQKNIVKSYELFLYWVQPITYQLKIVANVSNTHFEYQLETMDIQKAGKRICSKILEHLQEYRIEEIYLKEIKVNKENLNRVIDDWIKEQVKDKQVKNVTNKQENKEQEIEQVQGTTIKLVSKGQQIN